MVFEIIFSEDHINMMPKQVLYIWNAFIHFLDDELDKKIQNYKNINRYINEDPTVVNY
jgi:hypothetical protein